MTGDICRGPGGFFFLSVCLLSLLFRNPSYRSTRTKFMNTTVNIRSRVSFRFILRNRGMRGNFFFFIYFLLDETSQRTKSFFFRHAPYLYLYAIFIINKKGTVMTLSFF